MAPVFFQDQVGRSKLKAATFFLGSGIRIKNLVKKFIGDIGSLVGNGDFYVPAFFEWQIPIFIYAVIFTMDFEIDPPVGFDWSALMRRMVNT
jgi:hypothetical protein